MMPRNNASDSFDADVVEAAYDASIGFEEALAYVYDEESTVILDLQDDGDLAYVRRRATWLAEQCLVLARMIDQMLAEREQN